MTEVEPTDHEADRLMVTFAELFAVLAQAGQEESTAMNTVCRDFVRFPDVLVPAGLASLVARDLVTINGDSVDVDPRLAVAGSVLASPRTSAEVAMEWAEAATLTLAWETEVALAVLKPRAFGTFELQLIPPVPSVADFIGALAEFIAGDAGARALRARLDGDDASVIEVGRTDAGGWSVTAAGKSISVGASELATTVDRLATSLLGAGTVDAESGT